MRFVATTPTETSRHGVAWVYGDEFVVNEDGSSNVDFRVESANYTGALYIDASADTGQFLTHAINTTSIELNYSGTGNRYAYIDFHGDDTYTDYAFRILRSNTGANATTGLLHRGTGNFYFETTEAAQFAWNYNAGNVMTLGPGLQLGSPTGGDKGSGTLNVATDIYKNNSAYTNPDYVLEHYYRGTVAEFINSPGAREYQGLMPLDVTREFMDANLHLPWVDRGPSGAFGRFDMLLVGQESIMLYVLELEERIRVLEGIINP
jgi:hypothetical protein